MSLLSVEGLCVSYGDFRALHGVSLSLRAGQTIAIIGANGAGKSTLLNALMGLAGQKQGRITYDGTDITRAPAHLIARAGITLVPEGRRLFPTLAVEDNLIMGTAAGRKGAWTLELIYDLFPRLGELRALAAGSLSGGQQQMVAIGRALMTNPRILLCDEISLGLAPKVIGELYACFDRIKATGVSVVLIEQNVMQACAAADHIFCLLEGRVSLEGNPRELAPSAITTAYFGTGGKAA